MKFDAFKLSIEDLTIKCHIKRVSNKPKRPRDANLLAKSVVDIATGEYVGYDPDTSGQSKGGKKGGFRRAASLTPEQREDIARLAARARWGKD